LGENTSRAPLYVALTRGRHTNTAHLYQQFGGETEHGGLDTPNGAHTLQRGTSHDAVQLARAILSNDRQAITAYDVAACTPVDHLEPRAAALVASRAVALARRQLNYQQWQRYTHAAAELQEQACTRGTEQSQERGTDHGLEL
jgi:hypothetical protein